MVEVEGWFQDDANVRGNGRLMQGIGSADFGEAQRPKLPTGSLKSYGFGIKGGESMQKGRRHYPSFARTLPSATAHRTNGEMRGIQATKESFGDS